MLYVAVGSVWRKPHHLINAGDRCACSFYVRGLMRLLIFCARLDAPKYTLILMIPTGGLLRNASHLFVHICSGTVLMSSRTAQNLFDSARNCEVRLGRMGTAVLPLRWEWLGGNAHSSDAPQFRSSTSPNREGTCCGSRLIRCCSRFQAFV